MEPGLLTLTNAAKWISKTSKDVNWNTRNAQCSPPEARSFGRKN